MRLRGMSSRPNVSLPPLESQLALAQESVMNHKTALFPFDDAGFRHQLVAEPGGSDKARPRLHQGNPDDPVGLEELTQRKSGRAKQRRGALIEPTEIVGVEDDFGGITISELDPDSNAIHKHIMLTCNQESTTFTSEGTIRLRSGRCRYTKEIQKRQPS